MNTIFHLVLSTLLLVQLGTAALIPIHKRMSHGETNRRIALARQIFSNNINEYDPPKTDEGLQSHTCVYYNSQDECHNSNDGCGIQYETCQRTSSNRACFTVWNGGKKSLQGCWLYSSRNECTPGECVAKYGQYLTKEYDGTYFCCCFGDNCNENYGLSNGIPRSI